MIAKLLLAHLVSDFLLQPNQLIKFKNKSVWGVFIHAFIVFSTASLVLLPFLDNYLNWFVLIILSSVHFLQDKCKIVIDKKTSSGYVKHFLYDQVGHLLMIVLAGFYLEYLNAEKITLLFNNASLNWYTGNFWALGLSFLIIMVPAWDIFLFQFKRYSNPEQAYHPALFKLVSKTIIIFLLLLILAIWKSPSLS